MKSLKRNSPAKHMQPTPRTIVIAPAAVTIVVLVVKNDGCDEPAYRVKAIARAALLLLAGGPEWLFYFWQKGEDRF
jgi:hypothetical protein